jgi:hypothetical protein
MKISELEAKLAGLREQHGDITVMVGTDDGVHGLEHCPIDYRLVTEEDEYPKDWEMPTGFEFVEISVFD